ncbi:MAG TPA: hypothetical protein DEA08_21435 [Planctomycetes bacterium]|nr:hypothetical protein [Planctomycetota bacterium]|tara:strand:- start:109 stop:663 length:555 start_codon:yes stop_codon:yes gene_type:complete
MPELEIVAFDGGPIIAIPESTLVSWGGIDSIQPGGEAEAPDSYSPGDEPTDYDRACAISTWAMLLDVGGEQGLVMDISDEPGPCVAWVPRPYGGVFLGGGVGDLDAEASVVVLEGLTWVPLSEPLVLNCEALISTTAAAPGADFLEEDHLRAAIGPGTYDVSVAESADSWAVGVRLRRRATGPS